MTKHIQTRLAIAAAIAVTFFTQTSVHAHEYWIEPLNFSPAIDEQVAANLKVGSNLKGQELSYVPQFTVDYRLTDQNGTRQLEGKAGDRPALVFTPERPGLNVISYVSSANRITFQEWEKFNEYLTTQGMTDIAQRHVQRGLPQSGFAERYSRYVKSLIDVGSEQTGQDKLVGMKIELLALSNPYALDDGDELTVQLYFQGTPLGDHQVSIFSQDQARQGELEITRVRTNENGKVSFTLHSGEMYVINAIKMVDVEDQQNLVWESFWGSLTFNMAG